MCLSLFLISYVSRLKRRGRYHLLDIREIGKVMGERFYKRGNETADQGTVVFPNQKKKGSPPQWKWLHPFALVVAPEQMKPLMNGSASASSSLLPPNLLFRLLLLVGCFSPSLQSFLSHSLQGGLILSPVWTFLSAQSSALISFYFSLHLYCLRLVKSDIKSYKVLPMERRVSHCVFKSLGNWVLVFPNSVSPELSPKQFGL